MQDHQDAGQEKVGPFLSATSLQPTIQALQSVADLRNSFAHSARIAMMPSREIEEALRKIQHPFEDLQMRSISIMSQHIESARRVVGIWQKDLLASRVDDLAGVHSSWIRSLSSRISDMVNMRAEVDSRLSEIARAAAFLSSVFGSVDIDRIQKAFLVPSPGTRSLGRTTNELVCAYGNFMVSLHSSSDLLRLPEFVVPGATQEITVTGYVLKALDLEEKDRESYAEVVDIAYRRVEEARCEELLARVHPDLLVPYRGAREALAGSSLDRTRHVLASLRELWNHVLHMLAPDTRVEKWSTDAKHYHEGKPTREGRILYICRGVCHDALADFVHKDTNGLVELIRFLNRVHELAPRLDRAQLKALVLKTETWLLYLLEIDGENAQ